MRRSIFLLFAIHSAVGTLNGTYSGVCKIQHSEGGAGGAACKVGEKVNVSITFGSTMYHGIRSYTADYSDPCASKAGGAQLHFGSGHDPHDPSRGAGDYTDANTYVGVARSQPEMHWGSGTDLIAKLGPTTGRLSGGLAFYSCLVIVGPLTITTVHGIPYA
jgi:hypothetical protein